MQLLTLLVVLMMAGLSRACSCVPRSQQERFCKADFAVLVEVKNKGKVIDRDRVYKIKHITTYRSNVYGGAAERYKKIYTATDSAACGVKLERGFYLITGYYEMIGTTRRLRTGLCDSQQKFRENPVKVYQPPDCRDNYKI